MDDKKKMAMYKERIDVANFIDTVSISFFSPEKSFNQGYKFNIVKTALQYPDFLGVKMKVNHPVSSKQSIFNSIRFLQNNIKCTDENMFTYQQFFEEFLNSVVEDINKYEVLLLHILDNNHFSVNVRTCYGRILDVCDILCDALNNEHARRVYIHRRCHCRFSTCETIENGQYSYTEAFPLLERIPFDKPSFDLSMHVAFPVITHSRKHFFSFS